jgi:hypothetical protein
MTPAALVRRTQALAHAKRLALAIEGITGVDFGVVYEGGKKTRKQGIRFHLARKLHSSVVPIAQLIPKEIHGFQCDVLQANYQLHAVEVSLPSNAHAAFDPIRPGISIGNVHRTTTGTLGAIVRDSAGNRPCVLSNWHVLCASVLCAQGEPISQPGAFDAGSEPARVVARLTRWADLSAGYDAAIATVESEVGFEPDEFLLKLTPAGIGEPKLHMKLVKSGLSSGTTHAVIDGLAGSYKMDYSSYGDAERWMDGIHLIADPEKPDKDVSLEGDSGSVWIDPETKNAVALHFGGEDGLGPLADYAVAHPMSRICELLNISFEGVR